MEKGYYAGAGVVETVPYAVAIHNKNGKGLLLKNEKIEEIEVLWSQSTIKMEKGYYDSYVNFFFYIYGRNPQ